MIGVFGGIIIAGSVQHDTGWSSTGPQAGYFPLRVGILLCVTSVVLFVQAMVASEVRGFVARSELRHTLAMFLPAAALVIGMSLLGCYVPTLFYLGYMIRVHGGYAWWRAAAASAGIVLGFFLIFELWFQVPLAKGPIETLLGIY